MRQLLSTGVVECVEHSPVDIRVAELLDASGNLRLDLEARDRGYYSVSLQREGQLTLRAGHHVGLIPLTDEVALHVRPRVPLSNLSRIVDVAQAEPRVLSMVRAYADTASQDTSVRDLLAQGFIATLGEVSRSGMFRSYVQREEIGSSPRGAFDFSSTIRMQVRNRPYLAGSRWFERETDNAANRTLLFALHMIAGQFVADPALTPAARKTLTRLNALRQLFQGISLERSRSFLSDPVVRGVSPLPSTRGYYREALDVALSIIRRSGLSLDSPEGRLKLPSVVFDMSEVFESFVRNCLSNASRADSWPVEVHDGNHSGKQPLFNMSASISARLPDGAKPSPHLATPDVVFRVGGIHPLVVEVKYIPLGRRAYLREAVDQAMTYAHVYASTRVLLVHPWTNDGPRGLTSPGTVGEIEVWVYRIDLSATDLDTEMADFANAVNSLVSE